MEEKREILTNPETFHAKLQEVAAKAAPQEEPKPIENEPIHEEHVEEAVSNEEPEIESETEEEAPEESSTQTSQNSEGDDYKNRKFIPKSRFNQEIEKRKALEEQLLKEREDRIRFEEQAKMYSHFQQQNNSANTAPNMPELDLDQVDPLDMDTHRVYTKELKKVKEIAANTNEQLRQMQYAAVVSKQEIAFQKSNPDYFDAADYLHKIEFNGNLATYKNKDVAKDIVRHKYQALMRNTIDANESVPEEIYNLAKAYGYKPETKVETAKTGSNLKAINSNMKKSASISGLGNSAGLGSSGPGNIKQALRDPNNPRSGFDPAKFRQLIQNA